VLVAQLRRRCRRIVSHNFRRTDLDVRRPGAILPKASARQPRIINPQVTRPETALKPRYSQHDIQDAKGDGKGSSARLAQPRSLTGAWRRNFMAEYAFEK